MSHLAWNTALDSVGRDLGRIVDQVAEDMLAALVVAGVDQVVDVLEKGLQRLRAAGAAVQPIGAVQLPSARRSASLRVCGKLRAR